MATFVLDGDSSAHLSRGPVAVTLTTSHHSSPVRLRARTLSGNPLRTVQSSPSLLILPSITEETVIGAVPDHGHERFPAGTVLHVSLAPDGAPGAVTDTASLAPRDVSGLATVDLAAVTPGAQHDLEIRTFLGVDDIPLPPIGAAARIASRGVLGTDSVPANSALPVRCIVDASASMAPAFARHAVAACGDIVAGISTVVSTQGMVECAVLNPSTPGVQRIGPDQLGDLLTAPPAGGYGLATPIAGALDADTAPRSLTVVITDGPGVVPRNAGGSARPVVTLAIADIVSADVFTGPAAVLSPSASDQRDVRACLADRPDIVQSVVGQLLTPLREAGLLR